MDRIRKLRQCVNDGSIGKIVGQSSREQLVDGPAEKADVQRLVGEHPIRTIGTLRERRDFEVLDVMAIREPSFEAGT
ncbi:MAG: hypothetical protein NVSMB64_00390 [Candidatus Velthaea sp.]